MSNDNPAYDRMDRPTREAARWLVDLQDPNLPPEELLRWNEWQTSAPNRKAFDSLAALWHVVQSTASDIELPVENIADHTPQADRPVSEQAAYWYLLCVKDSGSTASRRNFLAWLLRSPENIAELFKIYQLDRKLRRVKRAGAFKQERSWRFKLTAFAASLAVGAALAFVAVEYMQSDGVVTTGASQWRHMTLPDGTAVHVDAHSKVRVAYTDDERIVHVYEGSAVFEVAKDSKRPFIARTRRVDAVAIGTRFEVFIDADITTTTVAEGVVKITAHGQSDDKAVTLNAGEELRLSNSAPTSTRVAQVDAERKLQWTQGWLILEDQTIAYGVEQLNRRNRTQIVVESPALNAKTIKFARFEIDAPERFARMIAHPGVTVTVDRKNHVIRLSE